MTTNRTARARLRLVLLAVAVAALAAVLVWLLVLTPTEVAQQTPPTTAGLTPATTRLEAADLTTTTTTPPPTTTTTTTTTTPPTTTTTTTPPTTAAQTVVDAEEHDHDHTETVPSTTFVTMPAPEGVVDCHGEYRERYRVVEECVLDRLQYIFEAFLLGTHEERMSVARDGHLLAGPLARAEAWAEDYRGDEYPPFAGPWSGFADADARPYVRVTVEGASWNGPDLLGVLVHIESLVPEAANYGPTSGMEGAPAVWVDGQWMVSYHSFCRLLSRLGLASQTCPDDPRPHIAVDTGAVREASGQYAPRDLSDEEYHRIRDHAPW